MVIKSSEYVISCVKKEQYPNKDNLPEFVFLGRSNVGKSSFINALTNRKNLAYTSSKPGKTLTLNFYFINKEFYFVDVPGYGYAQREMKQRMDFGKMIEEYLEKSDNLKKCFLIVDSRHNPTEDDILMFNYLKHFNIDVIVIATKCDKIPKTRQQKHLKAVCEALGITKDEAILVSSETKQGIDKVHAVIEEYL